MRIAFCTIAYNRIPEFKLHLESLMSIKLSYDKFLFCDYSENKQVEIVKIAKSKNIYKKICARDSKYGLRNNILSAIKEISNSGYDWVCVFEDDVLPLANFEQYLNDLIIEYPDVAHVSLWTPKLFFSKNRTYKSNVPLSGGGYVINALVFKEFMIDPFSYIPLKKFIFNLYGSYNYYEQYYKNVRGEINTWVVLWYTFIFNTKNYTVSSGNFWTKNVGFSGSGTNTKYNSIFEVGAYRAYDKKNHDFSGRLFGLRMFCAFFLRKIIILLSK